MSYYKERITELRTQKKAEKLANKPPKPPPKRRGYPSRYTYFHRQMMKANLEAGMSVKEVLERFGLSASHLRKLLKK